MDFALSEFIQASKVKTNSLIQLKKEKSQKKKKFRSKESKLKTEKEELISAKNEILESIDEVELALGLVADELCTLKKETKSKKELIEREFKQKENLLIKTLKLNLDVNDINQFSLLIQSKCSSCNTPLFDYFSTICQNSHKECGDCASVKDKCGICKTDKELVTDADREAEKEAKLKAQELLETLILKTPSKEDKEVEEIKANLRKEKALNSVLRYELVKAKDILEMSLLPSIGESSPKAGPNTIFRTKDNTMLEIFYKYGEPFIIERKIGNEPANFLFWVGDKSFCAKLQEEEWTFSLEKDGETLDKKVVPGKDPKWDRFIKINSRIYVSIWSSHKFYRVNVTDKLEIDLLGETKGTLRCVTEVGDKVFAGTFDNKVYCYAEGELKEVLEADKTVQMIEEDGNLLRIIDFSGCCIQLNIEDLSEVRRLKYNSTGCNFSSKDKIITVEKNQAVIQDKEGNQLETRFHDLRDNVWLVENNDKFCFLTWKNGSLIWNHDTQTLKTFQTSELLWVYIMT